MILHKCFALAFFLVIVSSQPRIDPLVNSNVGLIRGLRANDGDYSMFLGIPFGKVDLNNPFGPATPYPEFENTFEAYDDSKVCPQVEEFNNTLVGSLDCLNLNIFVPFSATSINRQPVLVWIYGGGFRIGFNNRYLYGPSFLVQHDVILVTINYRLGPYGFMCLDTPNIPGNQGLKDQLLALRWIKENIEAFGGDSNKITIFGESAGSISVDMHLHSTTKEKLFDKVILQSGTALSPVITEPIKTAPLIISEYLGFPTNDIDEALGFLTNVDSQLVIAAVESLEIADNFRPCIEKEFDGVESFINENWITASLPKIKNMPVLIGFNSNEWYVAFTSEEDEYYQTLNVLESRIAKGIDVSHPDFEGMEDIVRHFYFGDEPMSAAVKQSLADFSSDYDFVHPTLRTIAKYLDNDAGNIYLYLFSYVGERNFLRKKNNITSGHGALHCDEIGYLFDISYMKGLSITPEDQLKIDQMTTMWTNFVKSGNPMSQKLDDVSVQWTPITSKSKLPYLNIDSELTLKARPFSRRTSFWDLFYEANEHLQIPHQGAKVEL